MTLSKTNIAKILFTLVLVGLIINQIDVAQFIPILLSANVGYLFLFSLLYPLSVLISTYRWREALTGYHISIPSKELFRSYWLSSFYNNFLIHEVGGDLYKSIDLNKRYKVSVKKLFYTSFVERFFGLIALMCVISVFSLKAIPSTLKLNTSQNISIIISIFVLLFIAIYLYFYIKKPPLKLFKQSVSLFKPAFIIKMFLWSMLLLLQTFLAYWLIFFSLGETLSLTQVLTYIPLILISGVIPLTPNSLGIREGAAVLFLGQTNMTIEVILAGMLLIRSLLLLTSSLGAFIFLHTNIFKNK